LEQDEEQQCLSFQTKAVCTDNDSGRRVSVLIAVVLSCVFYRCPTVYASDPTVWSLVFSDEFDGPTARRSIQAMWSFDTGTGCPNNVVGVTTNFETYTSRAANSDQEGGFLVIKALKETFTGTTAKLGIHFGKIADQE